MSLQLSDTTAGFDYILGFTVSFPLKAWCILWHGLKLCQLPDDMGILYMPSQDVQFVPLKWH